MKGSSPGSLLKHARTHGFCKKIKEPEVKGDEHWDENATKDWVHAHVLEDLQPLSAIQRKGCLRFHRKYMPDAKLCKRSKVQLVVKEFAKECKEVIKEKIRRALDAGCKLTLGVDTWKSKGKKGRHYNLLLAWWVDPNWERQSVCLDVRVVHPREKQTKKGMRLTIDNQAYQGVIKQGLEEYSISAEHCAAFLSDHTSALRKALKALGFGIPGCGCHRLQLWPRHALP